MKELRISRRMLWAAALVLVVLSLVLSVWLVGAPPPGEILLSTGDPNGGFAALGRQYKTHLERMGLKVKLVGSRGTIDNIDRLLHKKADVAFVQAGVAAEVEGADRLRGLAAVGAEPLWIFSRTGKPVGSLRELAGRTVALGPPVSGTDALGRRLLKEFGVTEANTTFLNQSMGELPRALQEKADFALVVASCEAPVVRDLIADNKVHLVTLQRQAAVVRRMPYLRPAVLPEGVLDLQRNLPTSDTALVAPGTVLAAREELDPRVVEQLLMAARAIHSPGSLVEEPGKYPSLEGMDLQPHIAAERFMKSGESLLSRLLPYRGVRLVWQVQLLLMPLLALLPLWKAVPLLYTWRIRRILKRHYVALGKAERQIDQCSDPVELCRLLDKLDALRTDLEAHSRKLPADSQRDVYHWRLHVALVRTEARDRLGRLGGRPPASAGSEAV